MCFLTLKLLVKRSTLAVFLAGGLLATVTTVAESIYVKSCQYRLFDWLINYEGGFVRRGLVGQGAFEIHRLTGISSTHTIFALQIASYALYFLFAYRLLARIPNRSPFVLLIYSPFLFFFQIADWLGGSRKEILFFALFAVLAYTFAVTKSDRRRFRALCIVLGVFPALLLSHEMFAFCLPYVLFFAGFVRLDARRITVMAILVLLSVGAFGLAAYHHGDSAHVEAVCSSLRDTIPASNTLDHCVDEGNAISWLANGTHEAHQYMRDRLPRLLMGLGPALLLVGLGFLPLSGLLRQLPKIKRRLLLLSLLLAVALSLPVFVVAIDWGRLIYVHAVAVALILMALAVRVGRRDAGSDAAGTVGIRPWMVAVYFLGWHLSHMNAAIGGGLVAAYFSRYVIGP